MILVGLTGGIGSGKSTVSGSARRSGAVVIDADAITRQLQEPGQPVLAAIVERFGSGVLDATAASTAPASRRSCSPTLEALKALERIVHPAVGAETARRIAAEQDTDHVVVLDVPLLVETGRRGLAAVIVVDVPTDVAVERLVSATGHVRGRRAGARRGAGLTRGPARKSGHRHRQLGGSGRARAAGRRGVGADPCLRTRGCHRAGLSHPLGSIDRCLRSRSSPTSSPPATSRRPSTQLAEGIERGDRFQTLLGITGSGKSATIAWTIEKVQRPTLVLAPNKSARRAAGQRVPGVLPAATGSSTSSATTTTTSPRRTSRRATRTSRRTARSTTRSTGCATRPPPALLTRRDVIVVAQRQLHLRHGQPRGVPGPAARAAHRASTTTSAPSCASSSTCSTTATT